MFHQPGGITIELTKDFVQRIKGIVTHPTREFEGSGVTNHLIVNRAVVKGRRSTIE